MMKSSARKFAIMKEARKASRPLRVLEPKLKIGKKRRKRIRDVVRKVKGR